MGISTSTPAELAAARKELKALEAKAKVDRAAARAAQQERDIKARLVNLAVQPAVDYLPAQLLCNQGWIQAELFRLGATEPEVTIGLVKVTTSRGGAEHRPLGRFDRLPVNPTYYSLRQTPAGKLVYEAVLFSPDELETGPLPPLTRAPLNPNRRWGVPATVPTAPPAVQAAPAAAAPAPVQDTPPAPPAVQEESAVLYRRIKVKGKRSYIPVDGTEAAGTTLYRREGDGKAARYHAVG